MNQIPLAMRMGGVLWGLIVIVSLWLLYGSRPRAGKTKEASRAVGQTIAQGIFCIFYWIALFTVMPKAIGGDNALFFNVVFQSLGYICFLK